MERGQDEDERERIRCGNEKSDDAECQQRTALAGELLLRPDRPPWQKPAAGDDPTGGSQQDEGNQRSSRPRHSVQGRRVPATGTPKAECPEGEKHRANPSPEPKPASVAAESRRDPNPAPATPGEEVDRSCEERKERCYEHDFDRPTADQALTEEDVRGRALGK